MTATPDHERVLIVDFGSQVTQLIARRLRESGVYCEIHPYDKIEPMLADFAPKAVILSGGPASVHEAESPAAPQEVFEEQYARSFRRLAAPLDVDRHTMGRQTIEFQKSTNPLTSGDPARWRPR